jgi:DNA-binding CsgD family transcriptional regulator
LGQFETDWDFSQTDPLTEIQLRAIELTLEGNTDVHIAQTLGINRRTLWRWKNLDNDYRGVLNNARIQHYAAAADRYQMLLNRATTILAQSLQDPANETRFRAAAVVLNMAGCFRPLPPKYFPAEDKSAAEDWPEPVLPPKVG